MKLKEKLSLFLFNNKMYFLQISDLIWFGAFSSSINLWNKQFHYKLSEHKVNTENKQKQKTNKPSCTISMKIFNQEQKKDEYLSCIPGFSRLYSKKYILKMKQAIQILNWVKLWPPNFPFKWVVL